MPRIKNGFVFAALVLIGVASVQGQIIEPPPIDTLLPAELRQRVPSLNSSPLFLPMIDDVIHQALYQSRNDQKETASTAQRCQLNAPLPTELKEAVDNGSPTDAHPRKFFVSSSGQEMWVLPTPELQVMPECPCCDGTGLPDSCSKSCQSCASDDDSLYPSRLNVRQNDQAINQYCDDVSKALLTTLHGSRNNPQAQQRAIQTALKMVAEMAGTPKAMLADAKTSSSAPEPQVDWRHYLSELKSASVKVADSANPDTSEPSLLEPVYATQYRNTAQLKKLTEENQILKNSLISLEQRFASFAIMQQAKLKGSEVRRMMNSIEEDEARERELAMMQAQVKVLDERIRHLLSRPVRQANHLEPIYAPDNTLRPRYSR